MIVNDIILEKHYSGPLYHSTLYRYAIKILKSGKFKLSYYGHNLYQFSFSRSKNNYYRQAYVNDVVFVLDGSYYKTGEKFKAEPFDFFAKDPSMKAGPSRGEAEERIIAAQEYIKAKGLQEIHVQVNVGENGPSHYENLIDINQLTKEKNIPTYYYDGLMQRNDYQLLNKKKAFTNLRKLFVKYNYVNPETGVFFKNHG